jgi:hypothetical protein
MAALFGQFGDYGYHHAWSGISPGVLSAVSIIVRYFLSRFKSEHPFLPKCSRLHDPNFADNIYDPGSI